MSKIVRIAKDAFKEMRSMVNDGFQLCIFISIYSSFFVDFFLDSLISRIFSIFNVIKAKFLKKNNNNQNNQYTKQNRNYNKDIFVNHDLGIPYIRITTHINSFFTS